MTDGSIQVLDEILHTLRKQRDQGRKGFDSSAAAAALIEKWHEPLMPSAWGRPANS